MGATAGDDETEVIEVSGESRFRSIAPEASTRVDLRQFDLEATDLGQILNRQQGVAVQRSGGLGSAVRFTLNGLSGNQIRFFVDGVPVELAGLGASIADIAPAL
ncbi:MAG: TonB-dependent receptor plug domain-containing protein, partial [Myxococcota bacterium]